MSAAPDSTPQFHPHRWKADLALGVVALIWGTTFVIVKAALSTISTSFFLSLRFWLAALAMGALFIPRFRQAGWHATGRGLRGGMIAGIFLWLGYLLQTTGLLYTTAGKSGFITGMYIVLVPLIGAIIYRKWPQISEVLGVAVAGAGLVLLTLPTFDLKMNEGDLLTLGCAVAFAFHLLILGYFSQRELFEAVAFGQIFCTAILSTLSLLFDKPRVHWSAGLLLAIAVTGIFATALAFSLQTWGQKYTTPTRTAVIFALEPVFALLTAVIAGGEAITAAALGGAGLILAGILLVELKPIRLG